MFNQLKDKTVLYIEDDTTVLKNISTLLQHYFRKVLTAEDGKKGYALYREYRDEIDLLIVDIELPGLNGIELVKLVRKEEKALPVVVISAYTKVDYLLESVELQLTKYVVKPFTSRKLTALLESLEAQFSGAERFTLKEGVQVDRKEAVVTFEGERHALTPRELAFLDILGQKGSVTYDDLDRLWREGAPTPDAIRSFIKSLRKKLPAAFLRNRQNLGYYIES